MRHFRDQHLEMAQRLHERAQRNSDLKQAKKQAAMARVFRLLAAKAASQGPMARQRRKRIINQ
jgi:hypothetical protein